jgi:hypothetical protein
MDSLSADSDEHCMSALDGLSTLLNDFIGDAGDKDPYMLNGRPERGGEEVKLLATGVSASRGLFGEAVVRQADAV